VPLPFNPLASGGRTAQVDRMDNDPKPDPSPKSVPKTVNDPAAPGTKPVAETGGPPGPEPTRYGDWERGGRCIDF
jgi:hypothetical protein